MSMENTLKEWKSLTNRIVETWLIKYFDLSEEDAEAGIDWEWLHEIGGIVTFADYYIDFGSILECLNKDINIGKFFEWYQWCLENHPHYISLQSFVYGAAEIKQKEVEQLKLLRERVEIAKKELENYENKDKAREEHEALRLTGMFYEFYPELTGDWEKDREQWVEIHKELEKLRGNNVQE